MEEKIVRNGDCGRRQNFGLKLNVHIQYNMLRPIWPAPVASLARKLRATIYQNKVSRPTCHSFLNMIRCSNGPKTYWGYYQDYLVQIFGKKSKKSCPWFSAKNRKFPKGIVWGRYVHEDNMAHRTSTLGLLGRYAHENMTHQVSTLGFWGRFRRTLCFLGERYVLEDIMTHRMSTLCLGGRYVHEDNMQTLRSWGSKG